MTCKICTWRAETAGIGTSGKFVIGSTNYQRCLITLQKWPRMSYFTNHFLLYLNLVGKRVSLVCLLRPVTPFRGNFSWKICNLTRQINQVFLGSALIFRELGLASSSFLLKNLGKAIWSITEELIFTIFLIELPLWPARHTRPPHPQSELQWQGLSLSLPSKFSAVKSFLLICITVVVGMALINIKMN